MSRRLLLRLGAAAVLVAVFVAIWFSPLREHLTRENIRSTVEQIRAVWYAPIVYVLVYALGCVVALPASIFVIAAGFIWGWLLGGCYAMIGGTLGAIISFFAGRFIGEGLLDRFGRIGKLVRAQVDHAGFTSLLILRNIPGIPFAALNYGAGVAGVRFRDYFFATIIGIAPSKFVFTYCADALFNGSMSEGDAFKRLAIVCGLVVAMILLPALVKRFAGRRVAADVASPRS
ncbi:MAG TPA: VTT domain-containing protein [Thermoanaerobaculia bacterium]|nr:VTT domain-containing protein [Thermoanaerobaculia bacterium]